MKTELLSTLFLVVLPAAGGCQTITNPYANPPLRNLAIQVVDDRGVPVSSAYVRSWSNWKLDGLEGFTDTNGLFRYSDKIEWEIAFSARKPGYYKSSGWAWRTQVFGDYPKTNLVVTLKRVIEPVEMQFKDVSLVTSIP